MESLKSKLQTIVKLANGLRIKADKNNWALFIPPRDYWYFPSLDLLVDELLDFETKHHAAADDRRSLLSLKEAVQKSSAEVKNIVRSVSTPKFTDLRRLGTQEDREGRKNDD